MVSPLLLLFTLFISYHSQNFTGMSTIRKRSRHRENTSQIGASQHETGSSSQPTGSQQVGLPPQQQDGPDHHEVVPFLGRPPCKRTRGPNRAIPPPPSGQPRLSVAVNNVGQPTGTNAGRLSRFIGVLAMDGDIVPISYSDWRLVPDSVKQGMMDRVLVRPKFTHIWLTRIRRLAVTCSSTGVFHIIPKKGWTEKLCASSLGPVLRVNHRHFSEYSSDQIDSRGDAAKAGKFIN
ncbi:hypothetical protein HHK36_031525 [Tetracentron sinense]|uniref:Uncharacterized protein n=1 Tax=Tetracentron sinense TaxID=13715 RepID=A0A834YAJ2_TETSI|nr:hypothetical protein HHK36_031525 [Tetracentron sinense]